MHICCAPCAAVPVQELRAEGLDVAGFFYNPNIHPYQEYLKRKEAVEKLSEAVGLQVIFDDSYDFQGFLREVAYRVENRCEICYEKRVQETARMAKQGNFDAFTSTLLISPHQDHEMIKAIGGKASNEKGIELLYRDYRSAFKKSFDLSQKYSLYRQQYCGCIYSEYERYASRRRK